MRKQTVAALLAVIVFLVSSVGTAQAAWRVTNTSTQEIDLSGVKAMIIEEYEHANDVYPGNTVDKIVDVKNTGESDAVVRLKVEKAWGVRLEDGELAVNETLPTDNILIDYNDVYWLYDATDNYFYYKGLLEPGEITLEPLFRSFTIDENSTNEYMGHDADILVTMDCVQASADGVSVWGKSFDDLGIEYEAPVIDNAITKVTFVGGTTEFVFDPDTTDLFANFKSLLPGETRSQTIEVSNTFEIDTGVEIFLRAEDINQSFADDSATLELVNKLLREFAVLKVTDENGNVIYNGPVWGEPYSEQDAPLSMSYDISLGMFATGESKKLTLQLGLSKEMDNEYQNLIGLIKWVWIAQDTDYETVTINGSKTWKHGANPIEERPKELIIYVKEEGTIIATETVTAEDHWKWSFTLPRYNKDGKEIEYNIDEEPILGYSTEIDGNDVINTHETYEEILIEGNKTWEHGKNASRRPTSIVIHIQDDTQTYISKRVSQEDGWSWSFSLPKYDESGGIANYRVVEDNVQYYKLSKTDGYSLKNTFVSQDYPGDVYSPKTGNTISLAVWGVIMLASGGALVFILIDNRRSKNKSN